MKKNFKKIAKRKYNKILNSIIPIRKIVKQKSLYSSLKRKSTFKRYRELIHITLFEGKGLAYNYNKYGFDIENFNDYHDYICGNFLHTNSFRKKRISVPKFNYISSDKFLIYCYLSRFDKKVTPSIVNLLNKGKTMIKDTNEKTTKDILENMKNGEKLCFKILFGCAGKGFFLVEKENDEIIVNHGKCTIEKFYEDVNKTKYIVQEFVYQHEKMSAIAPDSLNTLRIVTIKVNNKIKYLGTMFRCGSVKGVCVDNACNGGIFVGVNDDGTLKEKGYLHKSEPIKQHPVTGIKFEGYKIPYFKEAVDLCKEYHKLFPGIKSLGWDIAITKDGPIIVELNTGWQTSSVQMCNGGFRKKIEELYGEEYNKVRRREEKKLKKENKYR